MTPESPNPAPPGPRPAKLRILMPIVLSVAALVVFLALFWNEGARGKKSHARRGTSASQSGRSPVGGQDELEDLGNERVTGGSPVGGGSAKHRSADPKDKGDAWWAPGPKSGRETDGDRWWAPDGGKESERAGREEAADSRESPVGGKVRASGKPAQASSKNPGEAAGAKGGPDDYWWRK